MLHASRNMTFPVNTMVRDGLHELEGRLPPGWRMRELAYDAHGRFDAAEVIAPDGHAGLISLVARARLEPKGVPALVDAAGESKSQGTLVVLAGYLSEGTRTRLRDHGVGYLDLTGNVWIVLSEPGLYIETQGASKDPIRSERPARSLRGLKAGRIVRALIDSKAPPGVRELAARTKIDAGYVSRVLTLLETEALITRVGRGRLESVDWPALLRRWAAEAPLESRGDVQTYLEPRGISALVTRLGKSDERYVVTGSLAAAALAPVAPARLATVWIQDATRAATRLGLRPADAGANVLLIEPGDEGVFEGAATRDDVCYAAPSQVAVDLLTSPGRGPAEAEELIRWMQENEETWRR